MFETYYRLAKPGIVYGNAVAALAGFLFASEGHPYVVTLLGMLLGIALVMASACVFNNYLDRGIDDRMARTKGRALVTGEVSGRNAIVYAIALGLAGIVLLVTLTNPLTAAIALFGHVAYVVLYGIAKRTTVHGTIVGSIAGAVPPVVGYVAVTNQIDLPAALLFLVLVVWQMPHFYAIALFRLRDYRAAGLPVLPVVSGVDRTKLEITYYIIGFIFATSLLTIMGYTGFAYAIVMTLLGLRWLQLANRGYAATDDALWARSIFKFSLYALIGFCVMISLDAYLV